MLTVQAVLERGPTHALTQTDKLTDATDHPTYATAVLADVSCCLAYAIAMQILLNTLSLAVLV